MVGGVAGGASCAARLRRLSEDAEIIVFERGPYVSFANCGLPYYVGNVITPEKSLLVATPELFSKRFNVVFLFVGNAIGVPLAGFIFDATGSYRSVFVITTTINAIAILGIYFAFGAYPKPLVRLSMSKKQN